MSTIPNRAHRPRLRLIDCTNVRRQRPLPVTEVVGVEERNGALSSVVVEGHVGEEDSPAPRLVLSIEGDDGVRTAVSLGAAEADRLARAFLLGASWLDDGPSEPYAIAYNLGREAGRADVR